MADQSMALATGASTVKPPLFDANNYAFWKFRMENYLKGTNIMVWSATVKGPLVVPDTDPERLDEADQRRFMNNHQALNTILCALTNVEYTQVMGLTTAHDVWRKLEVLYEGTTQVQKVKIQVLVQEYENFKILPNETINDMMVRFNGIIGKLAVLGKSFTEEDKVTKVLRSLPSMAWKPKITAIYEAKDLTVLKLDELVGNLCTYEMGLTNEEKELSVKGNAGLITFEDEEHKEGFALYINRKYQKWQNKGRKSAGTADQDLQKGKCFNCHKYGHYSSECRVKRADSSSHSKERKEVKESRPSKDRDMRRSKGKKKVLAAAEEKMYWDDMASKGSCSETDSSDGPKEKGYVATEVHSESSNCGNYYALIDEKLKEPLLS